MSSSTGNSTSGGKNTKNQQESPVSLNIEDPVIDNHQVLEQTARCFLRESFLRILWNLRGSQATLTFQDRPNIKANFIAFNKEFDEAVVKPAVPGRSRPGRAQKLDLVATSSIIIDYLP